MPIREGYILENICPAIVRACADDPTRTERTSLRVLMSLGTNHAPMSDMLRRMHPQVFDRHQEDARTLSFSDEAIQRVASGHAISEQLRDNVLIEYLALALISEQFRQSSATNFQRKSFLRSAAESLTDPEREAFYDFFRARKHAEAFAWFHQKMLEKGLARESEGRIYLVMQKRSE